MATVIAPRLDRVVVPTQLPDGRFTLRTEDFTVTAASYLGMGSGTPDLALVTVTRRVDGGAPGQVVYAIPGTDGEQLAGGWPIVWTGHDGVTAIVHAGGSGGEAKIVVRTARGEQTRTYTTDGGQHWTRTS